MFVASLESAGQQGINIDSVYVNGETNFVDTDNDGIGDDEDWDDDGDGVPDTLDMAPLNPANKSEFDLPAVGTYIGGKSGYAGSSSVDNQP